MPNKCFTFVHIEFEHPVISNSNYNNHITYLPHGIEFEHQKESSKISYL